MQQDQVEHREPGTGRKEKHTVRYLRSKPPRKSDGNSLDVARIRATQRCKTFQWRRIPADHNIVQKRSKSHRLGGRCPWSPVMTSGKRETDLPTGFARKPGNLHPMNGSSRSRRSTLMGWKASLPVSGSTGKLNSEALSHEIRSVYSQGQQN